MICEHGEGIVCIRCHDELTAALARIADLREELSRTHREYWAGKREHGIAIARLQVDLGNETLARIRLEEQLAEMVADNTDEEQV